MNKSVADIRLEQAEKLLVAPGHELCPQCSRKGQRVYHKPGQHNGSQKVAPEKPEVDDETTQF